MLPTDLSASKENQKNFPVSKSSENVDNSASKAAGRWTKEEHQRFTEGLKKFGKNWKLIEEYVGTRSGSQIRSHAQKFFLKLGKDNESDFAEPEIPAPKKDVPEPMRKESDGSTNCSQQAMESLCSDNKSIQEQLDLYHSRIETPVTKAPVPASSTLSIPISTNRLEELYGMGNLPSRTRKMSIDVSTVKPYTTNPLLEVFLSKIRTSENGLQMPKLTEIVEVGPKSRQRAFSSLDEASLLTNHLINNNFGYNIPRMNSNPRKFSEDNILIQNRLSQMSHNVPTTNLAEFEVLTKKIKKL